MSWLQAVVNTYGYVKDEVKRCLGLIKDEQIVKEIPEQNGEKLQKIATENGQDSETIDRNISIYLVDDVLTGTKINLVNKHVVANKHVVVNKHVADNGETGVCKQLVSGALGGIVSRTCTAPLDRLKIHLQASAGKGKKRANLFLVFHTMIKEGGIASLWRGNFINCTKIGPESSIRFFTFEKLKIALRGSGSPDDLSGYKRFIAGASAGLVAQTSIYPLEVIRTRLALGKTGEYENFFDCARKLTRAGGLRGFYRGIVPSLIGVIPHSGIDLGVYETLKSNWMNSHAVKPKRPSYAAAMMSGGISSICSMAICYPFALVRTNLQAQTFQPSSQGKNEFVTMRNTFKAIVRDHGIRGLYRGVIPNCMKDEDVSNNTERN